MKSELTELFSKMASLSRISILLALLFVSFIEAASVNESESEPQQPTIYILQFAGNIGLLAAGVGFSPNEGELFAGLIYGYLPRSVNGAEVHSISLKGGGSFYRSEIIDNFEFSAYGGLTVSYYITQNTYIRYPDHFPSDYYDNNALKSSPFIGFNLGTKHKSQPDEHYRVGFYFEVGTLSHYLYNIIVQKGAYSKGIWNLALGVSITKY